MTELKPCPFCGSAKVHLAWALTCSTETTRGIHCLGCDAFMTTGWFEASDEDIIRLWNRRTEE